MLNTFSEGEKLLEKDFKVSNYLYKLADWENFGGKEMSESENGGLKNKVFDTWNIIEWNRKLKKEGVRSEIGRLALFFSICERAKVKVISEGDKRAYYGGKNKEWGWSNAQNEISTGSHRIFNGDFIKPTSEISLSEIDYFKKRCIASDDIHDDIILSKNQWMKQKLNTLKGEKGTLMGVVLTNNNGEQIKFGEKVLDKKDHIVMLEELLYEKDKVQHDTRKIRIIEIKKGSNIFYIDEWFEELNEKDLNIFKEKIERNGKCEIDSFEDGNDNRKKCNGVYTRNMIETEGDFPISKQDKVKTEVYKGNGFFEGGWGEEIASYGNNLDEKWEWFSLELQRKYLKWRREISVVWDGKTFKWRSF
ncbi:hypothetical protein [Mycoplasma parvum]|uniref:Uncharacterized protein n=1 Tax=Mycoplasma parvum str. Indiana TaxID=1403316 RepID=U5NFE2_9MOLU|nr:hypothetical protein [Mycoplasma parvum]AGX88938.1 hypothetical protein PRV_00865 [Mycoplasma parvum str. Indiana]